MNQGNLMGGGGICWTHVDAENTGRKLLLNFFFG